MYLALLAATLLANQSPDGQRAKSDPASQDAATAVPASTSKKDRKVCKTLSNTGSRLVGERVCLTEKQWKQLN
jgi:hypothetical protein